MPELVPKGTTGVRSGVPTSERGLLLLRSRHLGCKLGVGKVPRMRFRSDRVVSQWRYPIDAGVELEILPHPPFNLPETPPFEIGQNPGVYACIYVLSSR